MPHSRLTSYLKARDTSAPAPRDAPVLAGCEDMIGRADDDGMAMPRASDVVPMPYVHVGDPYTWPSEGSTSSWVTGTLGGSEALELRVSDLEDTLEDMLSDWGSDLEDMLEDRLSILDDRLADMVDILASWDIPERAPEPDDPFDPTRFIKSANASRVAEAITNLYRMFSWGDSPQGHEYWSDVITQLRVNHVIAGGTGPDLGDPKPEPSPSSWPSPARRGELDI